MSFTKGLDEAGGPCGTETAFQTVSIGTKGMVAWQVFFENPPLEKDATTMSSN